MLKRTRILIRKDIGTLPLIVAFTASINGFEEIRGGFLTDKEKVLGICKDLKKRAKSSSEVLFFI